MSLDRKDIAIALDECPQKIQEHSVVEVNAWYDFKNAEIERRREYNKSYLEIMAKSSGKTKQTIPEIKAKIEIELYKDDLELVKKEADWKRAQNGTQYQKDRFASAKYKTKIITNDYGFDG